MRIFSRALVLHALVLMVGGLAALGFATVAVAQENLDANKSGAQLYAADCAICHKFSEGLSKAGGILGLESFLREHYAASRESAAILADYLKSMDKKHVPARVGKRIRSENKPKSEDAKPTHVD